MHGLESCSYCYRLHTLEAQYITMRKCSLDMVLICAEVSLLQFQKSAPPPFLAQCPCRCVHVVLSLSVGMHNLYTCFIFYTRTVGDSSKNVLTNNVMAAATKHEVPILYGTWA